MSTDFEISRLRSEISDLQRVTSELRRETSALHREIRAAESRAEATRWTRWTLFLGVSSGVLIVALIKLLK